MVEDPDVVDSAVVVKETGVGHTMSMMKYYEGPPSHDMRGSLMPDVLYSVVGCDSACEPADVRYVGGTKLPPHTVIHDRYSLSHEMDPDVHSEHSCVLAETSRKNHGEAGGPRPDGNRNKKDVDRKSFESHGITCKH